jgi:hypothetical protein
LVKKAAKLIPYFLESSTTKAGASGEIFEENQYAPDS